MILSCFSFVTFAEETYDTTLTITIENESYAEGEYVKVSVINGTELANRFASADLYFTYDDDILIPAEDDEDYDEDYFMEEIDEDGTEYSELSKVSATVANNESGDMVVSLQASGETGSKAAEGKAILVKWFKVKSGITGVHHSVFRWIHTTKYASTIYGLISSEAVKYEKVNFVDATTVIKGSELASEPESLPAAYAYVSENDLNETNINGKIVNITTNYAVAFGKVAPRKADATRVKAGFLLSVTNEDMTVGNSAVKDFEAINVSSENIFGGLFYGPGLEAGQTYYVMPYVTYSDGVTLYASEAKSFAMPE